MYRLSIKILCTHVHIHIHGIKTPQKRTCVGTCIHTNINNHNPHARQIAFYNMAKGYENIDDDKEKVSPNSDDNNNNDTHI